METKTTSNRNFIEVDNQIHQFLKIKAATEKSTIKDLVLAALRQAYPDLPKS